MSDEETHIKKKRTTALKIIVDEKTRNNIPEQRAFLANVFDCPEYLDQEEEPVLKCTVTVNDAPTEQTLYPEMLAVLKENKIDPSTLLGYHKEMKAVFKLAAYELTRKICEVTGMSDDTILQYKYSSNEQSNGVTIYFLLFGLETSGKTKTEIKTIHKENVSKLLNYLRMRKVPVSYDCEWSFQGNRACNI